MNLDEFSPEDMHKLRSVWETFRAIDPQDMYNTPSRDAISYKLEHGGVCSEHDVYMLRTASSNIPGDDNFTVWKTIRALLPEEKE